MISHMKTLCLKIISLSFMANLSAEPTVEVTNNNDSGAGSLREAIGIVDSGGRITFSDKLYDPGVKYPSIEIRLNSPLHIKKSLTIDGLEKYAGEVKVSGGSNGDFIADSGETRCIIVDDENDGNEIEVSFFGLKCNGGVSGEKENGANIFNRENLRLFGCDVTSGRACGGAKGAGIYNDGGNLALENCNIANNMTNGTDAGGAGIYNRGGKVSVSGGEVLHNKTRGSYASGAAIYSDDGEIKLSSCKVSNNMTEGAHACAGAICVKGGNLEVFQGKISKNKTKGSGANGGAIYSSGGTLNVLACTISDNQTEGADASGGGLYSEEGSLTIARSTISGNKTIGKNAMGGGIYSSANLSDQQTRIEYSTIVQNRVNLAAGGGVHNQNGILLIEKCTLVGNAATNNRAQGGAISSQGNKLTRTTIKDSIVRDNQDSLDLVLVGKGVNSFQFLGGNIIGTVHLGIDNSPELNTAPLGLSTLGSYGGLAMNELPETMHPLSGSPAILVGNEATRTGQRGYMITGPPTLGAVQVATPIMVSTESELRTALENAANVQGQVISFAPALNGGNITLIKGQLIVPDGTKSLFIDASNLSEGLTIHASKTNGLTANEDYNSEIKIHDSDRRVFNVGRDASVTLQGLTLTGGWAERGGAICMRYSDSQVILNSSTIEGNTGFFGGGIYNSGTLILNSSVINNNRTRGEAEGADYPAETQKDNYTAHGAGIYMSEKSNAILNSSIIKDNKTGKYCDGGGIYLRSNVDLTINSSTLSGNIANNGGGIYAHGWSNVININSSTISGNNSESGATIHTDNPKLISLQGSTISNNQIGGGDYVITIPAHTMVSLNDCIIARNGNNTLPIRGKLDKDSGNNFLFGDPKLSPLGDYGGKTQTMYPLAGSPVISDNTEVTRRDQRGFKVTGPATIGAIQVSTPVVVSSEEELRAALSNTANTEGRTIHFSRGIDGGKITLSNGQLIVPGTVKGLFVDASHLTEGGTIDAEGSATTLRRVLKLGQGASIVMQGIAMTGGWGGDATVNDRAGGGIYMENGSKLTLNFCEVKDNQTVYAGNGGGIYVGDGSYLTLNYSTISGNKAGAGDHDIGNYSGYGGGIFAATGSKITLNSSTIKNNSTASISGVACHGGNGGGVYLPEGCRLLLNASTITENATGIIYDSEIKAVRGDSGKGGGIYSEGKNTLTINTSTISNNKEGNNLDGNIYIRDSEQDTFSIKNRGVIIQALEGQVEKEQKRREEGTLVPN